MGREILEHDFPVHEKSFRTYSVIHNHSLLLENFKSYFASCRNVTLLLNIYTEYNFAYDLYLKNSLLSE